MLLSLARAPTRTGTLSPTPIDSNGRLTKDADPLGGYVTAGRTNANSGVGWTVTESTSMGRTSSYQTTINAPCVADANSTFHKQQTNTWPNRLQATTSKMLQNWAYWDGFGVPPDTIRPDVQLPYLDPAPAWVLIGILLAFFAALLGRENGAFLVGERTNRTRIRNLKQTVTDHQYVIPK